MVSENADKIEKALLVTLSPDTVYDEAQLRAQAESFRSIFPVSGEEFEELLKRLQARLQITMDLGTQLLEKDHVPWLNARKPEITPAYWDRFKIYLSRRAWPPSVVSALDRVTDQILDGTGNPVSEGPWKRKGLVIGDVQSGKTATYTALCCKAADAGYRLIILLTGTLENLRRQTQERLDEGFVGVDSSGILSRNRNKRYIGVGEITPNISVGVFTSRNTDFQSTLVNQLGFKLKAFSDPILLVLKKNKRILQNLEDWLKAYNLEQGETVGLPLLLIDDEADNASINTSVNPEAPTAINERIRGLLALFTRSSYVGFTATPFANIYINPDTESEMLGDDLFPKDFLYVLDPPTNYLGPQEIFTDSPVVKLLREITDAEAVFPSRHRISLQIDDLPESLKEALRVFIVANTIRDLRGETKSHRSMLVNVSRFTDVQERLAALIDQELRGIQDAIRNYSKLSPEEATKNPVIRVLKDTWAGEYSEAGFPWSSIQSALKEAALPITVKPVNQRTGAASLDYAANREAGLRVVAVGGNSLSRGLTLEGLTVSYFYRNSMMYDTLLQMGRWFGYRDGYQDLCRVWLSAETMSWYRHITESTDELRQEVRRMLALGRTPKDFGLKVRSHPDSLIVTARNKMRYSREITRVISVSGQGIETATLRKSADAAAGNFRSVEEFFASLRTAGLTGAKFENTDNLIWRNVPSAMVAELLRRFQAHPLNTTFQGEDLAGYLERSQVEQLRIWDVTVPNGGEPPRDLWQMTLRPQKRSVSISDEYSAIYASGDRRRVGGRGAEQIGLTPEERAAALREAKEAADEKGKPWDGSTVADRFYRRHRSRPLLLIHVLEPYFQDKPYTELNGPLVALGLSFPLFFDDDQARKVKYRVNVVELRKLFESEEDEGSDDDAL